ncbi:MAG: IS5 family transposase [Bacteroidia bacterium]
MYSSTGRPAHPVRLMVGLLILKQLEDLGDETVVEKWVENPYYQYFCGMDVFQWSQPIDPTDLVYFRQRIGTDGAELILKISAQLHGKDALEDEVTVDSTVQSKAITYPTDAKLHTRIIEYVWRIAEKEGIRLRQSYRRTVKQLMRDQHNSQHPKRKKPARKALRKLRTTTGRLVRDLVRKLPESQLERYAPLLAIFEQIMTQQTKDSHKIYSIHEPEVSCIAKGKAHPKYEFGSKATIMQTKKSGVIVAAQAFQGNPYDGHTLLDTLLQYFRIHEKLPKVAIGDRGFRSPKMVLGVQIISPDKSTKDKSPYQKRKARTRFRRRAAIEPCIGHLKAQFGLDKNWLRGAQGDQINLLLAAAAYNLKKWMNRLPDSSFWAKILTTINCLFKRQQPKPRMAWAGA